MPSQNAVLNYRLAGFSVPEMAKTNNYQFQIVADSVSDDKVFEEKITIKENSSKNRCIILLPSFGTKYTWRVVYTGIKNEIIHTTSLYHFSTGNTDIVNTSRHGLDIKVAAKEHNDMLLLLDYVFAIYDMDGNPVWYAPASVLPGKPGMELRDFKPTADGTFTGLINTNAYEFDYNGNILWQAPNNGKISKGEIEYYHHELTKLANGHYMVAGFENILKKIPGDPSVYYDAGDTSVVKGKDGHYNKRITSGTLIEYDAKGNIIWSWKASEHFTDNDYFKPKRGLMTPFNGNGYLNSFEFDEADKVIYISLRDVNKLLKIAYPSGEILNTYGADVNSDLSINEQSVFYGQHCFHIDKRDKNIYMFNNNFSHLNRVTTDNSSHVSIYKQPTGNVGPLIKVWDFPCSLVNHDFPLSTRFGSVSRLSDDCMLVCMGNAGRAFIVNKNKQVLWDAIPFTTEIVKDESGASMKKALMMIYRINDMQKADIEKFIFRGSN